MFEKNYFRSKKMLKVQKVTELRAFTVCEAPSGVCSNSLVPMA
jgi:hypothetical protein